MALRLAAMQRMHAGGYGISPCPTKPTINRRHIDGPYLSSLDGQFRWLTPWERLLTKFGIWDAWDIERRHFPLPASADTRPKGGDATKIAAPFTSGAVPKADAQPQPGPSQ